MRYKTVTVPRGYDGLHIELPGCIVNIDVHLVDAEGRKLTRVDVAADGDRYAGDTPWWAVWGDCDRRGGCTRVIKGLPAESKAVKRAAR